MSHPKSHVWDGAASSGKIPRELLKPIMPRELFQFEIVEAIHVIRFKLPGSLDTMEFDQLNESLFALLKDKAAGKWVLDLTQVDYLGSALLGLFVNIRQQVLRDQGELVLAGLSQRLLQIFRTCCLERLFTIRKTETDAVKFLG